MVNKDNYDVVAYTDGACKGNPGIGGWGVVFSENGVEKELCGGEFNTTNNKMELTAVIKAFEECSEDVETVLIITDSQYVMKGITEWVKVWQNNGWKTAKREPVKNKELWIELIEMVKVYDTYWKWVRGHNTNTGNIRADELANKGIFKAKKSD
jgi:ribonuclease HI